MKIHVFDIKLIQTYSVRNDFTGLVVAALIAWKLTVSNAINMATGAGYTINISF